MDWKTCLRKGLVKQSKRDEHLSMSLQQAAAKKITSQAMLPLNDETATSKISLSYDALREHLEALATLQGYKIYNHECYCALLKEIMRESSLGDRFDKVRDIRNKINYYGKDVSVDETRPILKDIAAILESVKKLIGEKKA